MKTLLYILTIKEDKCANPWVVDATSEDLFKIEEQYKQTKGDKMLMVWHMMKGVRIIRADVGTFQMCEDFTNIDMPFDNLAGPWRACLYLPVYHAIAELIKRDE